MRKILVAGSVIVATAVSGGAAQAEALPDGNDVLAVPDGNDSL